MEGQRTRGHRVEVIAMRTVGDTRNFIFQKGVNLEGTPKIIGKDR